MLHQDTRLPDLVLRPPGTAEGTPRLRRLPPAEVLWIDGAEVRADEAGCPPWRLGAAIHTDPSKVETCGNNAS